MVRELDDRRMEKTGIEALAAFVPGALCARFASFWLSKQSGSATALKAKRANARAQADAARSSAKAETAELKAAHAHELEAARRDAAAAWRLAKELETRVLSQAKMAATNTRKFSNAMAIGRRLTGDDPKPPATPLDLT